MPIQQLNSEQISEENDFIMPYEIMPLRIKDTNDLLQVAYILPTITLALPWLLLVIVIMCTSFYFKGPIFGSWWLSIGFVLFGVASGVVCLFMMQKLIASPLKQKRVRLLCKKQEHLIELPVDGLILSYSDIQSIVSLYGWYHYKGKTAKVSELSLIYKKTEKTERVALFLTNKWKAKKIGQRLSELTGCSFLEIKKKNN